MKKILTFKSVSNLYIVSSLLNISLAWAEQPASSDGLLEELKSTCEFRVSTLKFDYQTGNQKSNYERFLEGQAIRERVFKSRKNFESALSWVLTEVKNNLSKDKKLAELIKFVREGGYDKPEAITKIRSALANELTLVTGRPLSEVPNFAKIYGCSESDAPVWSDTIEGSIKSRVSLNGSSCEYESAIKPKMSLIDELFSDAEKEAVFKNISRKSGKLMSAFEFGENYYGGLNKDKGPNVKFTGETFTINNLCLYPNGNPSGVGYSANGLKCFNGIDLLSKQPDAEAKELATSYYQDYENHERWNSEYPRSGQSENEFVTAMLKKSNNLDCEYVLANPTKRQAQSDLVVKNAKSSQSGIKTSTTKITGIMGE
ncbi:MAG: hypothetical protein AABZ55_05130 [Bdellovibrionota bacterium]